MGTEAVICGQCQSSNASGAKFCSGCGRELTGQIVESATRAPAAITTLGEKEDPPKSWVTALLLSIFFGWLAADRFYLGHQKWGIFKICSWYFLLLAVRSHDSTLWAIESDSMEELRIKVGLLWFRTFTLVGIPIVWNLLDIARILGGNMKDSKGRALVK